jgi:GAF domain-containing protein
VTDGDPFSAAVAAGLTGSEEAHASLLRSIVEVGRAIFSARASSILLFDEEANELEFAAIAGEGSDSLIGRRFPADAGVAGWVLSAGEPLVIEDVHKDQRFAAEVAESTGFVPNGLMAVPLLADDRAVGVMEVLDRPQKAAFSAAEMDLLSLFANQAAIALDLVQRARRAKAVMDRGDDRVAAVARLARVLDELEGERADQADRLLRALEELLATSSSP